MTSVHLRNTKLPFLLCFVHLRNLNDQGHLTSVHLRNTKLPFLLCSVHLRNLKVPGHLISVHVRKLNDCGFVTSVLKSFRQNAACNVGLPFCKCNLNGSVLHLSAAGRQLHIFYFRFYYQWYGTLCLSGA